MLTNDFLASICVQFACQNCFGFFYLKFKIKIFDDKNWARLNNCSRAKPIECQITIFFFYSDCFFV